MSSQVVASKRIERTLLHIQPTQEESVEHSVELFEQYLDLLYLDAQKDKDKTPLVITGIEHPNTIDLDRKVPSDAYLFPLYTRPMFPHMRMSTIPRQALMGAGGQPMDRLKKVIERLTTETPGSNTKQPLTTMTGRGRLLNNKQAEDDSASKPQRVAYFRGPIVITDKSFIDALIKLKQQGETHIVLCLVHTQNVPVTKVQDVYPIGVLSQFEIVDGNNAKPTEVVITGVHRVQINQSDQPKPIYLEGSSSVVFRVAVRKMREQAFDKEGTKNRAAIMSIVSLVKELCKLNHPLFKEQLDMIQVKLELQEASDLADLCASLTTSTGFRLQQVLSEPNIFERLRLVQALLKAEIEVLKIASELSKTGENNLGKRILGGLGGGGGGASEKNAKLINEYKERLKGLTLPEQVQKVVDEELAKLASLDSTFSGTEHYVCRNYLNWLTQLPWGVFTNDNLDLRHAEKVMEEDHYGLRDVKDRVLEFIAVASLKGTLSGKILCFVGPPGTGKTSFGKSIARATNRKFVRFSVGGMHDVAEIKGHRRTYVGAMPGKLIQAFKNAKSSNPVILIDEIDKLSRARDGDPASALLEVLDPEQNSGFLDHYLDVPVDLSKVLFICTANSLDTVPRPLLDRMEVIQLSGYFVDEKMSIARQYLIPKIMQDSGLKDNQITIEDSALYKIIAQYCREAGVRSLQKQLEKLHRKVAIKIARAEVQKIVVTAESVEQYLGKPKFLTDRLYEVSPPGVVTGLAWNSMGGSLIWIESVFVNSKKGSIKTTGKLGNVMKESIEIAYTFAKKFLNELDPNNNFFETANIHIHFPEGATPKDGPSAGCAIVTSLLSLAFNRPTRPNLAMTGEITLTGKVLPVGGIKEKTMAAKRGGITEVIYPAQNRRDFDELPEQLKQGLNPQFVEHYADVYTVAFSNIPHVPTESVVRTSPQQ